MKLEDIKKGLAKYGINVEIIDYSLKEETKDELWEHITLDMRELEKWYQKKDLVMICIVASRIRSAAYESL